MKEKLTVACVQAESALFDRSRCRGLSPMPLARFALYESGVEVYLDVLRLTVTPNR